MDEYNLGKWEEDGSWHYYGYSYNKDTKKECEIIDNNIFEVHRKTK